MTGVIRWGAPPPPKRSTGHTDLVLEQLQSRPGEWAVVAVVKNNGHHVQAWRRRGCESVSRKTVDGDVEIYARWPEPPPPKLGGYMAARRARGIDT